MAACSIRWYKLLSIVFIGILLTACQSLDLALPQDSASSSTAPSLTDNKIPKTEQADTSSATKKQPQLPACISVKPKPVVCRPRVIYRSIKLDEKMVIGEVESIVLPDVNNLVLKARIDTGAETSSLHVTDSQVFERDGKRWVSFVVPLNENNSITLERPLSRNALIKQKDNMESMRRQVVVLSVRMGTLERNVEFTLADREGFEFSALIGRNFLKDIAIVDVGHEFLITGAGVSEQR